MKVHNLFISHSWSYFEQYNRLVNLLDEQTYFNYQNYSVSKEDPIHDAGTTNDLRDAIKRKMGPCGIILILAGVYATYSKWINIEVDLAKNEFSTPKPIIAIEPWASEKTSSKVKEAADRIVKWNTDSIVNAIRELAN